MRPGPDPPDFRTPDDLAGTDPAADIGSPGAFPFTRGIQPTMYRGRPWTMRQYAGFATAAESNRRYRYLLAQGVTGLSVAFDLPTQIGYDSDHPLAAGEVGKVGVAIDSIDDMAALFDGIPLDRVSTSMTINATAIILLALYVAVAKRQGADLRTLAGTVQNDILKEYVARGTYIYPPRPSLRIVTDIIAFCERDLPQWNTISISGYHIREAGSTAVQEVGLHARQRHRLRRRRPRRRPGRQRVRPAALLLLQRAQRLPRGDRASSARPAGCGRASCATASARPAPRAQQLRFHTQTAGSTLTAQQPDNNIVRVALQALAAVLGGTQSLHCNGRTKRSRCRPKRARRIALRTQQILLHESGVANTVDPVGGSYAIEAMTNRIEREARALIDRIDAMGGTLAAIEGRLHPARDPGLRLPCAAGHRPRRRRRGRRQPLRGCHRHIGRRSFAIDPEMERQQVERVRAVRAARERDGLRAPHSTRSTHAARGGDNLVPPIIAAVEAHATLGEICRSLRRVFGEYRGVPARLMRQHCCSTSRT